MRRISLLFFLLLLSIAIGSCKKEKVDTREGGLIFGFYPRPCSHILLGTASAERELTTVDRFQLILMTGQDPILYYKTLSGEALPPEIFKYRQIFYEVRSYGRLSDVWAYNFKNKAPLSPHNSRLEEELKLDYDSRDNGARHSANGKD